MTLHRPASLRFRVISAASMFATRKISNLHRVPRQLSHSNRFRKLIRGNFSVHGNQILCAPQRVRSVGSFPPFSAIFAIICLCSQIFIEAESPVSPVYFNSDASCLRAVRLLSSPTSFIRSTIDLRQSSVSGCFSLSASRIAATSTDPAEAAGVAPAVGAGGAAPATGADGVADAAALVDPDAEVGVAGVLLAPKILLIMVPEILIVSSLVEWSSSSRPPSESE